MSNMGGDVYGNDGPRHGDSYRRLSCAVIVVEAHGMMVEAGVRIPSYSYTMHAEGGVETEVEQERLQPPREADTWLKDAQKKQMYLQRFLSRSGVAGSGRAVRKVYILERRQLDLVLGRWRQVVRVLVGGSHNAGEEAAKEKREQRLGGLKFGMNS